ncbi:MAG: 3-hydroxybutyryl-CoA dehydrogenase [Candidatus Cloacimonetes bacterium 4572_55]|nr:MAG: 3-hydroxybutyryl-CoA dehydrogenase [Candidatus Cloacimonetes bacterium 4572_55]
MSIETIGVIGAGVMGGGVAQTLAQTGHKVILVDINDDILQKAEKYIRNQLRFQQFFHKPSDGERLPDLSDVMARITLTTDYQQLQEADFVIENVTEKWEIKKSVYEKMDQICGESCLFAADTSAISITRIASVTSRADRVLGIHFMNPVPMKKTVEMIRGFHTSDKTLETAQTLMTQMGKEWVVVNDSPGFVSNRILMLTVNEAIFLLQERVAGAEQVDTIFKSCFGHPMGPLETADLIGLDTILYSLEVLYEEFNDSKYRPCPLLKKMVHAGLYGRKNGQGFYSY